MHQRLPTDLLKEIGECTFSPNRLAKPTRLLTIQPSVTSICKRFSHRTAMARNNWNRDETLVAFNIYCRTPFGRLHGRNPEIIEVANHLGRTPNALAMKCCNLAAFDSALAARGIKGLAKASRTDEELWHDFKERPEDIAFESEKVYARLLNRELRVEPEISWEDVHGLDRSAITKVRVNQNFFRSIVISGYRGRCAICELPIPALLVASHIVPWCVDKNERMNPQNGICLCVIHDRAFDRGLLIIGADYKIAIHRSLTEHDKSGPVGDMFLKYHGREICLPDRWLPGASFLERHTELVARITL
jgi:putative restriction endonuclease